MRFTKTDEQLGEIVVETESKTEAAQLRAQGFTQDDGAAPAKGRRKSAAATETTGDAKSS